MSVTVTIEDRFITLKGTYRAHPDKDAFLDRYTHFQPPSIALIDDDPLFAELFKEYAYAKGFYTQYYVSVEHIPNLSSLRHYHVILIDMDLGPGPSGLDVATKIRSNLLETPIVLISGDTLVGFDSRPECVDAFVTKRIGLEEMLHVATDVYKRLMQ